MDTDLVKLLNKLAPSNSEGNFNLPIASASVLVIGEAMLDCYLEGFSNRLCPEAPVPVVDVTDRKEIPGGAANTAMNVHTLGGSVTFLSVIGDDGEGALLKQALSESGVSTACLLTQSGRRTLSKQRVMAASQLLVRFDQGSTEAIDGKIEQALINELERCFLKCDALIVSDYGYGILTAKVIAAIAKLQNSSPRVVVVDSKNLTAYRHVGVTAVKPNYNEAIQLLSLEAIPNNTYSTTGDTRAEQIAKSRESLLKITGAQIVAITLDAEGALIFERDRPTHRTYAHKANTSSTAGAGDTFISALTLALAIGAKTPIAADLASAAAAVVVGKEGTTTCSNQELRAMLLMPSPTAKYLPDLNLLLERLASYRASKRRIVFTNGCFDLLHAGHVSYLNRAKALGDILIIGVNSDLSVSRLKGTTRPINPLADRIPVLAALGCVDHLVAFDDDTPSRLIEMIRPDIYVKGGDYTRAALPEALIVEQLGGVVQILPLVENRSTTKIIERIKRGYEAPQGNQHGSR